MKTGEKKEMSKEEAERLLRSLDVENKVFGIPPKVKNTNQKVEKDW